MADGCWFIALLISLTLKVTMTSSPTTTKDQKKENRKALKQLFSPSALIFYGIIFQSGIMWGVKDTYMGVYLQDTLGASSQMLGKNLNGM